MREVLDEFVQDFEEYESRDDVRIDSVYTGTHFENVIISHSDFYLAPKEDYGQYIGEFRGVDVYNNIVADDLDLNLDYNIKTVDLYEECNFCSNKKMYDENKGGFYCPICDNTVTRLKDKFFNLIR